MKRNSWCRVRNTAATPSMVPANSSALRNRRLLITVASAAVRTNAATRVKPRASGSTAGHLLHAFLVVVQDVLVAAVQARLDERGVQPIEFGLGVLEHVRRVDHVLARAGQLVVRRHVDGAGGAGLFAQGAVEA